MSGLVLEGVRLEIPGVRSLSWLDEPTLRIKMPEDGAPRHRTVPHALVYHTTHGIMPQPLRERAARPDECTGRRTIGAWRSERRQASGALIIDADGLVLCTCDLVEEMSYHCPSLNTWTIGIEVVQQRDGGLFPAQLRSAVLLSTLLCGVLRIPRKVLYPYRGRPFPLMQMRAFQGIYGHRDADNDRGQGDPGDHIPLAHLAAGFTAVAGP